MIRSSAAISAIRAYSIVLLCVFVLSCAGPKRRVPEPEPYVGPVNLEVLKNSRVLHGVTSLRSEVKVKIKRGKKGLGGLNGVLIFHEPDYFRMRVYTPFGSEGVDVVHSDGLIQAYVPENGTIYEAQSPAMVTDLRFVMEENDKYYTLLALKPEDWGTRIHATYAYDHRTLLNKRITIYKKGEKFVYMQFRDFVGAVPLSAKFELLSGYTVYLDLIDPEVDVDIPQEYFEPMEHDDLTVLPLERILSEGR